MIFSVKNYKNTVQSFQFRTIIGRSLTASIFVCLCLAFFTACNHKKTLFEPLPSSKTGVTFINKVEENDKYNVLDYMNIYTGAGVAAGDINNDGLTDLFFSGNQTSGRLYLNKGNLQFEDVTEKAGITSNRWQTGVAMVDINQDGFLDIYVNISGNAKFGDMHNLLYINNQNNTFTEKAAEYGIAETRQTMNASFFDYDIDGDLDLFLITNPADSMLSGVNSINERLVHGEGAGTDILYQNNGNNTFTDVTKKAGILIDGFSLGAAISDVNSDGFPDIYVSNDFLTNDILYINNGDGTFTDKINDYLKHTSFASMGNDIADINNDGLPDIYVLDMLPEDNLRKKMLIPPAGYDKFLLAIEKGYTPQYTRNTLQLNNGNNTFSDISFLSGVSSTDWSWSPLFADYDNDGDKDLMVTNGFYRDLGNMDYINYQARTQSPMGQPNAKRAEKLHAIHALDNVPLQNYLFENNSDLTFSKRSDEWGFTEKGFSNGACYADLDNDGDLEVIINSFNSEAKIYKNNGNELNKNNYLTIQFNGKEGNKQGIGAKIWIYNDGKMQFQELNPYRGYESSMEQKLHFGLGKATAIDSLVVAWTDGKRETLRNISSNKTIVCDYKNANFPSKKSILANETIFQKLSNPDFTHQENSFNDFKLQPLLPHLHSQEGPNMAVGDVNGDGREDFYMGGAAGFSGNFFLQNANATFTQKPLNQHIACEDAGILLFDADGDKDLDLYVASGGSEQPENSPLYQDRLYMNDGKGNFTHAPTALPTETSSGSCATAADFDKDGDLDIFVGGRVNPGKYPIAPKNYLLRNDGTKDNPKFTDITAGYISQIGMVTAASWSDFDKDGWVDLVLVGEFMPLTFLKNNQGTLVPNAQSHVPNTSGWWNSLAAADFDGDGDTDYIAGNLGKNNRFGVSPQTLLAIYAKDYDKNGRIDPIMTYFIQGKNYIAHTRDEMVKQINAMRGRFKSYNDFAQYTFEASFTEDELSDAYIVKADCFESSYFENKGNGQFERHALPIEAQFAPIYGIVIDDFNGDGHADALIAGNSYTTEASTGRYDAMTGLLLLNDGKGHFSSEKSAKTGFTADKDVKSMKKIHLANKKNVILVGNNADVVGKFIYRSK
jgi:enediyne biosynthesis protein E4